MALWDPSNLATAPAAWWDPTVSLTIASGFVTQWTSRSGTAVATASGNARPATTTINGITVPTFSGSGQYLTISTGRTTLPVAPNAGSVFIVANDTTSGGGAGVSPISWGNLSNGARRAPAAGGGNFKASGGYAALPNGAVSTQGYYSGDIGGTTLWGSGGIMGFMFGAGTGDATTIQHWKNAVIILNDTIDSETATNNAAYIGATYNSPLTYWTGPIPEVIVLGYIPSLDDRQKIEGYLAWKYGYQTAAGGILPSGHPYYAAAPQTGSTGVGASSNWGLGSIGFTSAAQVKVQANSSVSLGALTVASAAQAKVKASSSVALGSISFLGAAKVLLQAAATNTLNSITTASSASVKLGANSNILLDGITVASTGSSVAQASAIGSVNLGLDPVGIISTGSIKVQAGIQFTLDPITSSGLAQDKIKASTVFSIDQLSFSSSASARVRSDLNLALNQIGFISTGSLTTHASANAAIVLDQIGFVSSAKIPNRGDLGITLGNVVFMASAIQRTQVIGTSHITLADITIVHWLPKTVDPSRIITPDGVDRYLEPDGIDRLLMVE